MQGGKSTSAVGAAKEAAANVGASAWAGKEKTKAVVQGTVEKAKAHDPAAKEQAEARKQERISEVEALKRDAMHHNAVAKEQAAAGGYGPSDQGALAVDRNPGAAPGEGARPVAVTTAEAGPAAAGGAPRAGSDHGSLPHA